MIHGIRNSFLYASSYIINHSTSSDGKDYCSCGTGFWVKNGHDELCLITNKHVLQNCADSNKLCDFFDIYIWETNNGNIEDKPRGYSVYRIHSFNANFPLNQLDDVACVKWPFCAQKISGPGNKIQIDYVYPYSILATQADFEKSLSVCDMLVFIGYPEPYYDTERKAPILRSGVIASDPRFNYKEHQLGNCLAYEAFSLGGSSGSPVLAIQKGFKVGSGLQAPTDFYREIKLIGINFGCCNVVKEVSTNQIPELTVQQTQHSGLSLLYKSTSILEAIDS